MMINVDLKLHPWLERICWRACRVILPWYLQRAFEWKVSLRQADDGRAKVSKELREKDFAESDHGMQWSKSTCWIAWGSNIVRIFWLPLLGISQAQQICSRQKWITVTVFAPLTFFTQKSAFETAGVTSGFNKFIERLSRGLEWNAVKWEQKHNVAQQVSAVHAAPRRLGIPHDWCCATPWCSQALWLALRLWLWAKQSQPQPHYLDRAIDPIG